MARKNRQNRFAIKHWQDTLPDIPAFVIGNGPTVKDYDLSVLDDYFTIGINRIFYVFDPSILFWQDIGLWTTEYHRLHNIQALKVSRDTADPKRIYYNFHLKGNGYKFETKTHILYGRGSSGPLAVQLAVAMGCRPIILLGMDCKRGSNGESDFYGNNPHWLPHTLDNCKLGIEFIRDHCPVEVINCGATDLWPRQNLSDVLKETDPCHKRGRQSYVRQILRVK